MEDEATKVWCKERSIITTAICGYTDVDAPVSVSLLLQPTPHFSYVDSSAYDCAWRSKRYEDVPLFLFFNECAGVSEGSLLLFLFLFLS